MKLIGITGSAGKTSVAEVVYQYLLHQGIAVALYSSNGMFVEGLTKEKDFLQTTLYSKELEKHLKEDEEGGIAYAIIEITAESVKRQDCVHLMEYELVALTNFYPTLSNHFKDEQEYLECKRKILMNLDTKKVLLRKDEKEYSKFCDINHITYGYTDDVDHRLAVFSNTVEGLALSFGGTDFQTNLISAYHARNLSCALAILSEMNVLDMEQFAKFAKNIKIRGRFEKIVYDNKMIVIDTGYMGASVLIIGLEKALSTRKYRVIYSNVHYPLINDWVRNSRRSNGEYLKGAKHIYLTNPTDSYDAEEVFIEDCLNGDREIAYTYIPNIEEACKRAIEELEEEETLIIFAREYYRRYRRCIEYIMGESDA